MFHATPFSDCVSFYAYYFMSLAASIFLKFVAIAFHGRDETAGFSLSFLSISFIDQSNILSFLRPSSTFSYISSNYFSSFDTIPCFFPFCSFLHLISPSLYLFLLLFSADKSLAWDVCWVDVYDLAEIIMHRNIANYMKNWSFFPCVHHHQPCGTTYKL